MLQFRGRIVSRHSIASRLPNYAKRARKAVIARNKLATESSPLFRAVVEQKQDVHGFRWAARTALTDLKVTNSKVRTRAINLALEISNQDVIRQGIDTNKPYLIKARPNLPAFPNAYMEALALLKHTSQIQATNLVAALGSLEKANEFLSRLHLHQRNLHTAWEKQEEFIKANENK